MIGLLYRELYLQRKSIITLISIYFMFIGLLLLVYLSLQYGNLHMLYGAEDRTLMTETLYSIITYFPAFLIMLMPAENFEIIASDFRVGWMRFQYCLPYTPAQYAAVKIILIAAELLLGLMLCLGNTYLSSLIFHTQPNFSSILVLILALLALCCTLCMLFVLLTLKMRSENANVVAIVSVTLYIVLILATALMPDSAWLKLELFLTDNGKTELTIANIVNKVTEYRTTLLPWCICITAGVLFSGFFAMTALFRRRENE